jgi:glycosyltransferase involved in cell wall biosynthesis
MHQHSIVSITHAFNGLTHSKGGRAQNSLLAEVLVADNNSEDRSSEFAESAGARVLSVSEKGYGAALRGGIQASQGRYVIMGDADDSYDFLSIMPILEKLREGDDLVLGNRFRGEIKSGAMPFLHKYLGNPVLSRLARFFFRSPVGDIYCGLRGFRRDAILDLNLQSSGMEYAVEMVVKSTLFGKKISEVPITLYPDGRSRAPHLRTWQDGWRTLRFMLMYSPGWLFLVPGGLLFITGVLLSIILSFTPLVIKGIGFDVNTLLITSMFSIVGVQLICFFFIARIFAVTQGFLPVTVSYSKLFKYARLETGIVLGLMILSVSIYGICSAVMDWKEVQFGALLYQETLRKTIPAVAGIAIGCQIIFSSFLMSIVGLARK